MKDQITVLMEALRLASRELQKFTARKQSRDATLDAVEAILYDPKVKQAVESLEPLVQSPPLVPDAKAFDAVK